MKMITLFLPEKYLEMLDRLISLNMYPNRSEALRMATWNFLHENMAMLKATDAEDVGEHEEEQNKEKQEVGKLNERHKARNPAIEKVPNSKIDEDVARLFGVA
ncbi:MAG: ribbon-helix-helix domain-containing protein [Promethearchaeota archaeon]